MTIKNKKEIPRLAREITCKSSLFGDEISHVVQQLNAIYNDAQRFGCIMTRPVFNMWGGNVDVTALPETKRHFWRF